MTSSLDPGSGAVPYRLTVDGFDAGRFRVHAFTGREALSEPYAFDLVLTTEAQADEDVERLALGRRAVLTWAVGKAPRAFYGMIAAVRLDEVHDSHRSVQYHVRFVPRLWLLQRQRRSRIFQGLSVPDVVRAVVEEAGIPTRWQLRREHPVREYVTQYAETDLRFVRRLLAEAGLYFFFAEGPEVDPSAGADALIPGHTVVFGDDAAWYPPIGGDDPGAIASGAGTDAPPLYFLSMKSTSTGHSDKITRFAARSTVRATSASFRDYDPDRPLIRPGSSATSSAPFPDPDANGGTPAVEIHDHHGPFLFPKWAQTDREAERMLRQERRRALTAAGESGCPDLSPGHRFALQDHPATHLDRAWVVVSVDHRGQAHPQQGAEWKVYDNGFACAPAEVTYLPPRPRRRSVEAALTATVVGPAGEEIHVDPTGQIKVQFHWDREGGMDERSSCWIRTMHALGGAGWGAQLIPRVGMEVVVAFDGGDPDKPIVLGSLYNGTHPPPFALPANKTRSGIRTQSSPGGGGSNELSFEDQAGSEQVYLHAQRDLDEVVERNHTRFSRGDERLRVLGSRVDIVEEDVIARVRGNAEAHVGGDRTTQVGGNRIDVVTGNSDARVTGTLVTRVEGKERLRVQKSADLQYAEDLTLRVRGCQTTLVGKHDARRSWVTHAEGTAKLSSSVSTEAGSEKELVLRVGKSMIRISAEKIEIDSPAVTVKGAGGGLSAAEEGLSLTSKKDAQVTVDKKLTLVTSDGASLSMEKEVKVDGTTILLNTPADAKDPPPKDPDPPTKIELTDQDGSALPYQRWLVVMDDGSEVSGTTDEDGKAEADLKSGGKIVFPDVAMPGDSPKGEMLPYVVRQGDYLTKLAWAHGFDVDEVWGHEKNKDLKELRKDHDVLAPGDVVCFPRGKKEGQAISKGSTNPYTAKVPKVAVTLVFKGSDNGPLANEPCEVLGLAGASIAAPDKTDGDGKLTLSLPIHLREIEVCFPARHVRYAVRVGDMDPHTERSGALQRLQNLGYCPPLGEMGPEAEEVFTAAIAAFQAAKGLPVTGVLDEATIAALAGDHQS